MQLWGERAEADLKGTLEHPEGTVSFVKGLARILPPTSFTYKPCILRWCAVMLGDSPTFHSWCLCVDDNC